MGRRMLHYGAALSYWIDSTPLVRFLLVEGSNVKLWDLAPWEEYALKHDKEVVVVRRNVVKESFLYGKGRGELLLLDEAVKEMCSRGWLGKSGEQSFLKVTGRLGVSNVERILARPDRGKVVFHPGHFGHADTRFFQCDPATVECLMSRIDEVDDNKGRSGFLEAAAKRVLSKRGQKLYGWPRPQYLGECASNGQVYQPWDRDRLELARRMIRHEEVRRIAV